MTLTIDQLAGEAYAAFEARQRDDDTSYVTLRDDAPGWLHDLVRAAHGDMLPDDWRYASIRAALGAINDAGEGADLDDLAHEWADGHVDVYTGARLAWLASDLNRAGYCDDAVDEGLVSPDAGIVDRIGAGQYAESLEVYAAVLEGLTAQLEELETVE